MIVIPVVDPLEAWGQSIRARLPGADTDAWLLELQNTVEEFCKNTLCLIYPVPLIFFDGVAEYALNPIVNQPDPLDANWNGVHGLYVHFAEFEAGFRKYPRDRAPAFTRITPGAPQALFCPKPAVVQVVPPPDANYDGNAFTVTTSLVPKRPIGDVPQMLVDYYFESILDGTVGRMMGHAKRPYSDPRLAEYHTRRYRNGMRVAKDETLRRWGNAERSSAFNPDWSWTPNLRHAR